MIQIILLIAGIFTAVRLPKLKRRAAADYPGVDPEKFQVWHDADIKSAHAFLIATWGTLLVQILLIAISFAAAQAVDEAAIFVVGNILSVLIFFGALIWAAILGGRASKLKKAAGIA